jgi:hypothetical protein
MIDFFLALAMNQDAVEFMLAVAQNLGLMIVMVVLAKRYLSLTPRAQRVARPATVRGQDFSMTRTFDASRGLPRLKDPNTGREPIRRTKRPSR